MNNQVWGQGAGAQSIWANSYSNWVSGPTTPTPAASSPTRTSPTFCAATCGTWATYEGGDYHPVYSFLARSHTTDSWVDITAHCQWLAGNGRMPRVSIDEIAFGFEITSSAGGRNFNCNSYSLWT